MRCIRFVSLVLLAGFLSVPVLFADEEVLFRTAGTVLLDDGGAPDDAPRNTYRVLVREGAFVEVIAASSSIDTWIDAVLPDGTTVSNDDYDGLNAGFLRMMPATGHLVLTVSSFYRNQEGPYTLTVTELPQPQRLSVGDRVASTLRKQDFHRDRIAHHYYVTGEAGDRVILDLISEDFDAFIEVIGEQGRTRYDDDSGRGFNSRLVYLFEESGSAIVVATSALGESTGSYELRLSPFDRTVTARYNGRLRADGRRAYDGRLFEVYEFAGRMGQSVTISLESEDFDPVLYLSYADGRHFAMDDDSGDNLNSLIDVVLPSTETYRIFVTPFYDGEGAYRLTIYE